MLFSYSKSHNIKAIQKGMLQLFIQICIVSMAYLVIRIDILVLKNDLGEHSLSEYYQQTLLLLVVISFLYIARINAQLRHFSVLVAGFFACMLIRELDSYFDTLVMHGFWLYLAFLVAFLCSCYAMKEKSQLLITSALFFESSYFYTMSSAIVIILVFSRLFGMSDLWQVLLGEHYIRGVKNVVEEGVEILGYSLLIYSSLGFVIEVQRKNNKSLVNADN